MRIRHIRESDWSAIVTMEADAYTVLGLSEGQPALRSRAGISPALCFVLENESQLVGYLLALPYPVRECPDLAQDERHVFRSRNLHLHDIVIAEEHRGRGLAKRLLRHLGETAGSKSYRRMSLVAVAGSEPFWTANGFSAHRDVPLPGSYGADAVYMSRTVPARWRPPGSAVSRCG